MPKVKNVEKKIWDVEGFDVRFKNQNGRDLRSDKDGIPQYRYTKMAKNDMTVGEYKKTRIQANYPGLDIDILYADGSVAPGQTKLSTVRDSYLEDDEDE